MEIPTVKIRNGDVGFMIINEADFDPATHQRYEEQSSSSTKAVPKSADGTDGDAAATEAKDVTAAVDEQRSDEATEKRSKRR